jgi:hypothetical protein
MANTSVDTLTEVLYSSMERIQQEPVGFLNSVQRDVSNVTQASFGTSIESVVTGDVTVTKSGSYTPQMSSSDAPDDSDGKDTFALDTHLKFEVAILPEQMLHADNVGLGGQTQLGKRIAKGLRAMRNQAEADLALAMYQGASRAVGTAGTTPFASNLNLLEDSMKILTDNGGNRYDGMNSVVMNTAAGANLRKLLGIQAARQPANDDIFERGILTDVGGYKLRESAGITLHTKGAGTGALVNSPSDPLAVGTTVIPFDTMTVNTTGIKAGDIITFAADTDNEYVVVTGSTSTSGNITIGGPGLQVEIPNNNAITIGGTYTPNVAFNAEAAEFASRSPMLGQDKALMHSTITDDVAGITYAYSIYPGEGMQLLRVQSFVAQKVWNKYLVNVIKG